MAGGRRPVGARRERVYEVELRAEARLGVKGVPGEVGASRGGEYPVAVEEQGQPSAASDSRTWEQVADRFLPRSPGRDDTDEGVSDGRTGASASALSSRWAAPLPGAGSRTARTTASAHASRQRAGKWWASLSRIAPVSDQARSGARPRRRQSYLLFK